MSRQQLGQGLPPSGRFSSSRQPSLVSSPPARSAFAFGGAAAAMSPQQQGAQLAHALNEQSFDPSDFPALGSAPQQATPSSAAANLFSSYASQAGQSALNGLPVGGASANQQFSADDFPALGGAVAPGAPGAAAGANGVVGGPGQQDVASLTGAVNGLSLAGRVVQSPGQEQASALAALQAQQHRANLLGSMNGQRSVSGAGASDAKLPPPGKQAPPASWNDSPQSTPSFASGLLPNGTPAPASAASSPLPPSSTTSSSQQPPSDPQHLPQQQQQQQQPQLPQQLRSPPGAVGGVGALLAAAAAGSAPGGPLNPLQNISSLPPPTAGVSTGAIAQTPAQQVLFSPADRFGLLGLLHTIKTSDPDLSMLALGNDLTNLGLDLGATENLYSSFITPWSDAKAAAMLNIEPEFHLPSCYNVQPPPANTKIGNFSDETLFFIFYSQPRDAMQEMAAHELYKHNWRYHKELRLWLTKEAGTEPIQKTATFERGSYIGNSFFDPVLWERVRKEFILHFESLETRRA
ncbi:hypothetical protein JCM8547_003922 [Rhodosporidiobolus lusitaniae]